MLNLGTQITEAIVAAPTPAPFVPPPAGQAVNLGGQVQTSIIKPTTTTTAKPTVPTRTPKTTTTTTAAPGGGGGGAVVTAAPSRYFSV